MSAVIQPDASTVAEPDPRSLMRYEHATCLHCDHRIVRPIFGRKRGDWRHDDIGRSVDARCGGVKP